MNRVTVFRRWQSSKFPDLCTLNMTMKFYHLSHKMTDGSDYINKIFHARLFDGPPIMQSDI
jgi:hypothetical protein